MRVAKMNYVCVLWDLMSRNNIAAKNSRLCARLAPIKEGRPVKIFTDNNVETIVLGNTEMNDSLDTVWVQV